MYGVWSWRYTTKRKTWIEVVLEDCQARKMNKEDAIDRCKWRKMIKDVRWSGWVWVGECFFWYWPTRVVPDQRPLNGCVCVCVLLPDTQERLCCYFCDASTDNGCMQMMTLCCCVAVRIVSWCVPHSCYSYGVHWSHDGVFRCADSSWAPAWASPAVCPRERAKWQSSVWSQYRCCCW